MKHWAELRELLEAAAELVDAPVEVEHYLNVNEFELAYDALREHVENSDGDGPPDFYDKLDKAKELMEL